MASFKVTVIVEVVDPFAVTEVGLAATNEVPTSTAPATKVTDVLADNAEPASVPVMVEVPATVPAVSVAV